MLLCTLGASFLGNMLKGRRILRAGYGNKEGEGILRAGYRNKEGKGMLRAGYGFKDLRFRKKN